MKGLAAVSRADLEQLLHAIGNGRLPCPLTATGLMAAGLAHLRPNITLLAGLDPKGVSAVLEAVLAERDAQRPQRSDLSGPDPTRAAACPAIRP